MSDLRLPFPDAEGFEADFSGLWIHANGYKVLCPIGEPEWHEDQQRWLIPVPLDDVLKSYLSGKSMSPRKARRR